MKNNKILIIVAILMLNVLVVVMVGQSLMGKATQYDLTLQEARKLAKKELCSRAIEKYNDAILMKDSLDVRLEMLQVYEKGLEIGELTDSYEIFESVGAIVDVYRTETKAYEETCKMLMKYGKYEQCAEILMQARDLRVTSKTIEEYRSQVRYMYDKFYAMYTDVLPSFDGMFTVATEGGYTFLDDLASASIDQAYLAASSFSEGYAFVVAAHPDGENRSIIINKDNQRQVYLDGVESSSGVGRAKNKDKKDVLLLSCKKGDKYSYYNIEGKKVFGDYAFAGRFRNNVAAVMESEGKWKLIDGTGKAITDTVFSDVVLNEFDECAPKGFIIAKKGDKYHIYDLKGEQVSDFACDGAKAFVDSYAAFRVGDDWGFVGTDGKVLIKPQYADAKSFSYSMGAVLTPEGWVFINAENEIAIQETFEDVSYLNQNGICFVKTDGYWCYLKMYYTGK